ncbi:gluconolactonase [Paenibacillus solisilvae]|uniref:Gluconolactonase n=1 Tax=Paenibacillus solisilvae TaxID=2486751 RepID=A0ABW0W4C1_9BACL
MKALRLSMFMLIMALLSGIVSPLAMAAPYDSYNYSVWEDSVPSPASYLPSKVITGDQLTIGQLKGPSDLFVSKNGTIYIADTGNQRIVVLNSNWKVIRTINQFDHDGKPDLFNKPTGLFVKEDGTIYVADYENQRVVLLNGEGQYLRQIDHPKSDVLASDFVFNPVKLSVDRAGRVYVVAKGVFEGIMQFDDQGAFIGYIGTNTITPNPADYFWKVISTKAQRAQMNLFVPTEFTNMDIDEKGFLFATNIDKTTDAPIKRLNPSGKDVLKRFGNFTVSGDLVFSILDGDRAGTSQFIDIKSTVEGSYYALDSLRGRIFTYDQEGNLLYIFGEIGSRAGTFKTPVAIDKVGEKVLVLDGGTGRITVFEPTLFGMKVNEATRLHEAGKEQEASKAWEKVLQLNANYDIAYIGIGKAQLREQDYKSAMRSFELGVDRKYYSIAFARDRKQWMRAHMGEVLTYIVLLAAVIAAWRIFILIRSRRSVTHEA